MMKSGSEPNCSMPNQVPARPKPVITSSLITSTSFALQISRTIGQYSGGGGMTPPVPIIVSPSMVPTFSGP